MYPQPQILLVLNATTSVKFAATAFLLSLLTLSWFHHSYKCYQKPCNLPVLNLEGWRFEKAKSKYISNVFYYLRLGREKFRDQPFLLWGTEGYITILPEKCVQELKSVEDSIANNMPLFINIVSDYSWYDILHIQVFRRVINGYLNPRLSGLTHTITEEVEYALQTELPTSRDWTRVVVNKSLLRIVSRVSGRIFVGALNRNEEWIDTCINFTLDLYNAGRALRSRSYFGKAFAIRFGFIPEVKRVFDHHEVARRIILPIVQERAKLQEEGLEAPNDMITWIMEQESLDQHPLPFDKQAELQLIVSLAAIHTTTLATTNFLYDLVARPEYFNPLRQEIDAVWNKSSDSLDKTSMAKLVKLDSFLKESQRLNPQNQLTFNREIRVKGGLTLSNGVHLKQGTRVAVAANQIALDPHIWENPDEFIGFRFADLRSFSKEDANKYQFVSTSPTQMAFGHGRHDCPGRFLASKEIKTILAYLIRKYDIKAAADSEIRPVSIKFGTQMAPNPSIAILMKERLGDY